MKLDAEVVALGVSHGGNRRAFGFRDNLEARGHLGDFVAVAHPHVELGHAIGIDAVFDAIEKPRRCADIDFGITKLRLR